MLNEMNLEKLIEAIKVDCTIDESNIIGDLKKQKDLLPKWGGKLNILEDKKTSLLLEIDRLHLELYLFYKNNQDELLKESEIKIHINGNKKIIELKDKKRIIDLFISTIKDGITSLRIKGKTLNTLAKIMEKEM